jgi:hypothetical protein
MKRSILILLFCSVCFLQAVSSAPAQSVSAQSAVFHVPPIIGSGISQDDNTFIFNLISDEILLRDFSLFENPDKSDFILAGSLSPYEDQNWYYDQTFVLKLTLIDNKTSVLMIEQDIVYSSLEDLHGIFPSIMQSIFALIPAPINEESEARPTELLYVGANAFWSPRNYSGTYESLYLINFGGGLEAEYHVLKYLSVGIGAEISSDWIALSANEHHQAAVLGIPLLVKGFFVSQSADYVLQPYAGIQLNISFNEVIKPSLFSGIVGFQYGVRFGPGIFYIDPRVSFDFSESIIRLDKEYFFRRHIIDIGISYKIGFFSRGKK